MACTMLIVTFAYFVDKAGKEGKNGDDDDTTSVMSFESSVVRCLINYQPRPQAPVCAWGLRLHAPVTRLIHYHRVRSGL